MPLAEYLASEQAREDVKALLADSPARDVKLGTGRIWHKPAGHASIKVQSFDIDTMLTLNKRDAWNQVRLSQRDDEMSGAMTPRVSAYYRPDGDRYVVTDLGEGVRALRIRTGRMDAIETWLHEFMPILRTDGAIEHRVSRTHQKALPEAICRVMLASLRVAGVGLTTNEGSAHAKG